MSSSGVFLDRDGTLNRDVPYCSRPEEFQLLPGVGPAIRALNDAGVKVIVVTNQSGIARGYYTENDLDLIHSKMHDDLAVYGAYVDGVYYCPHKPDDNCDCRKPQPGLLLRASRELNIDLGKSLFIGDSLSDMEAGKAVGCKVILLTPESEIGQSMDVDFYCRTLSEAARWITNKLADITETQ